MAASGLLTRANWRLWLASCLTREGDVEERVFRMRLYRRRVQAAVLLGVAGIGIIICAAFPASWTAARLVGWGIVFLVTGWMVTFAIFDIISTRMYYLRQKQKLRAEQSRFEAEVRERRNAQRDKPAPP